MNLAKATLKGTKSSRTKTITISFQRFDLLTPPFSNYECFNWFCGKKKKQKKAFVFLFLYREVTSFVSFKVGEI
jgi:hypothetical protein